MAHLFRLIATIHHLYSAMKTPIVVLSFGRSGSTWISDIISKNLGGLLLFEPLHRETCPFPQEVCYSDGFAPELDASLHTFLQAILAGKDRNRWLLRNHLFTPLAAVSQDYVDMVWDETPVLGFKEIRATYMIDWLIQRMDAKVVYLVRHPAAVIASLRRRKNFWNDLGFEVHWQLFMEHVVQNSRHQAVLAPHLGRIARASTRIQQEATMWAVAHKLAIQTLARHHLPYFRYEDFYQQPFATTRHLISYVGGNAAAIHPAHIFVPSMTTIRTVHGLTASESDFAAKGWRIFWDGVLTRVEFDEIMAISRAFGIDTY